VYADNVALPAFALYTRLLQQSIDISCRPGPQQQTCNSSGFADCCCRYMLGQTDEPSNHTPMLNSLRRSSSDHSIDAAAMWRRRQIIVIIIIKGIYIAQVLKGHKCAMSAEMAVWLRNCLYLYSYLHN